MPLQVVVADALLFVGLIFGSPTAVHLWRGDKATQRRLERVSIVRAGGTGDPRWVRSFMPRFAAAWIFALIGPVYFALGGGNIGGDGVAICGGIAMCVMAAAASVFLFGRPRLLIPPHMRPRQRSDSARQRTAA